MEGPSLVIATEEFVRFVGKKIKTATGTAKFGLRDLKGKKLVSARSWGKHLLLTFPQGTLRIHFLMFGSYRIDDPRPNRLPKMKLTFPDGIIYFYSCAIKWLEDSPAAIYDWSSDVMAKSWSPRKALKKIDSRASGFVCDVLMDQDIFSGVGNIIKNEVQFNLRLHPEVKIDQLSLSERKDLVRETRAYCLNFYRWKKINQLKRHWQIFRKPRCPICERKVVKKPTGKLERISHFCKKCQGTRVNA